jgi:2-(1,2-epoxy-1,2-dihydrophenyl)acetyl-CoA isomerase
MPKPVIASIQGPAAGIGAAFAMACDLRVMSDDAYILSVFSNIALIPDGGLSWLLPKYLGYSKAYEYAIEAKKIDAKECLQFGLANKVTTVDKLKEDTLEWAARLAKRSPQALANTKILMRESLSNSYWDTYQSEAEIQNSLTRSPQNEEAVMAFFEKREPNFD